MSSLRVRPANDGQPARVSDVGDFGMVPDRINPQWQRAYEARRCAMLRARARERGVSVACYMEEAERNVRAWVDGAGVRIRVKEPGLVGFLRDGRYKVMEEIGVSGGDLKHIESRRKAERRVLGTPEDAPASDRPVSGYLGGSDEDGAIARYGLVVLELDPGVRSRALFMLGDFIDTPIRTLGETFVPQPLNQPSMEAASGKTNLVSAATLADACGPHRYAEALVFGGVTTNDVRSILYTQGEQPSAEVRAFEQTASWRLATT